MSVLSTIRGLLSRRTPITPRYCRWCDATVRTITQEQRKAAMADGFITCECGSLLAPAGVIR